ncbi:MAG: Rpn family recombination-promoting nuclease/putative transposase [Eubacteriales bacterium]|nr:Rpn family recombination-promoting nuclease/putative transposase [Eubacteriales bacterium]
MNGTIFRGEQVVSPQYLREVPRKKSVLLAAARKDTLQKINGSSGEIQYLERERDIIMLHDEEKKRFFLACEGQSYSDYTMPLRLFTYDGIEYSAQVQGDVEDQDWTGKPGTPLTPVFHQVLYLGEKKWLSKHDLQEMMEVPEEMEKFRSLLPDYHIHLVDIHDQDPAHFHTEWKDIFLLMNHSRKKDELKRYIEENKGQLKKLTKETKLFLAILLDQYELLDNGEVEVKDLCKAWDGAMMMYREEALEEGLREGMERGMREGKRVGKREGKRIGMQETMKRTALNMYRRGYTPEETAGIVEESVDTVNKWYREFQA